MGPIHGEGDGRQDRGDRLNELVPLANRGTAVMVLDTKAVHGQIQGRASRSDLSGARAQEYPRVPPNQDSLCPRPMVFYPAQHDNCFTSFVKVCAQSFRPSTMVR